jgi:magnesium chelatase family protein
MPKLTNDERLELSIIASLAGEISDLGLVEHRPFREPHSSASMAAVVGGGRNAKPGEVTLAHKGVLFMDELPEFSRNVLESLRQPVESKTITVSRVNNHVTYPANFQLIAAMNPCKCGYFGSMKASCSKMPKCAEEYQNRISGPLFDRFDLQVEVPEENAVAISRGQVGENSKTIAARVNNAVMIQQSRYKNAEISSNAELEGELLQSFANLDQESQKLMEDAANKFSLSMRSFNKVLRVSRTIADLDTAECINKFHISEALNYRIARIRA